MPQTFPGFLVVSGFVLLVAGLIGGPVELFAIHLPKIPTAVRFIIIVIGTAFLFIGFKIYFDFMGANPSAGIPTLIK